MFMFFLKTENQEQEVLITLNNVYPYGKLTYSQ